MYRIQYDSQNAHMFFSYLPEAEPLLCSPPKDDVAHEGDNGDGDADGDGDGDAVMKDADEDHEAEDNAHDDAGEDGMEEGEEAEAPGGADGPPSKRVKLK